MTAPALYAKHAPLARAIARDYWLPGSEAQDVEQEALIGLWVAARRFEPGRGASFPTFARLVVKRRLAALLKAALAEKNRVLTGAGRDLELVCGPDLDRVVVARERLVRLVAAVGELTPLERVALARIVNDVPSTGRADDSARYRARVKLKGVAA